MSREPFRAPSGVRLHQDRSLIHKIRQWWSTRRLARCGPGTYVENNVGFLRYPANIEIGGDVIVKEGVRLCPAQPNALIKIGDNTSVGYHTFAFATTSIVVGNNCLIAPFCYLVDSNHGIRRQALIRDQEMVASPIVIEDDVWLGTGVTVLKGVRIGQGAVIGAGCVIAHDVAAYDVVRAPEPTLVGTRELRT